MREHDERTLLSVSDDRRVLVEMQIVSKEDLEWSFATRGSRRVDQHEIQRSSVGRIGELELSHTGRIQIRHELLLKPRRARIDDFELHRRVSFLDARNEVDELVRRDRAHYAKAQRDVLQLL